MGVLILNSKDMKYYVIRIECGDVYYIRSRVVLCLECDNEQEAKSYIELHPTLYEDTDFYKILKISEECRCNNSTLWFGKYKGKNIKEVDFRYLMWLFEETDKGNTPMVVLEVLRRAKKEAELIKWFKSYFNK